MNQKVITLEGRANKTGVDGKITEVNNHCGNGVIYIIAIALIAME